MNRTRILRVAVGMAACVAVAATVVHAVGQPKGVSGRPLAAGLLGENEIPPAETEGIGIADLRLNSGLRKIGMDLSIEDTASITRIHIHAGDAGTNGPVVVTFFDTVAGPDVDPIPVGRDGLLASFVAEKVDRDLIKNIRKNPHDYYVNVHTEDFPGGELRGQLHRP